VKNIMATVLMAGTGLYLLFAICALKLLGLLSGRLTKASSEDSTRVGSSQAGETSEQQL